MKPKWRCPKCGASAHKHGKGGRAKCIDSEHSCEGFICECSDDVDDEHGTMKDPCHNATCYHCGWGGVFPHVLHRSKHHSQPSTTVAFNNTLQFAIKCRWCGKDYTGATSDDSCPDCSAAPSPIIGFVNNNQGKAVHLWHNPDNSLFLEFVHSKKDLSGVVRATRYILSEAILSRTGALKEFDKDPKGKK